MLYQKLTIRGSSNQGTIKRNKIIILSLLFLLCAAILLPFACADTYSYVTEWGGPGSANGRFSGAAGVAVDSDGNVYVVDMNQARIQKFDSNGKFLLKWSSGFNYPQGIAVDSEGYVYVTDYYNSLVKKFTSTGSLLSSWPSNYPVGIAVDASGKVFVVEETNHIEKFTNTGSLLTTWGSSGSGVGEFDYPWGVAVDSLGNVYVVDSGNNRVQKFTNDGAPISQWGTGGAGNGEFDGPQGIAIDISDNVYITDVNNARVQKFSSNGDFITQLGGSWDAPETGVFSYPLGIDVDASGNIFVSDLSWNIITKFNLHSPPSDMWASDSEGNPKDQFNIDDDMFVSVLAEGQMVTFYVTQHRAEWNAGDELIAVTDENEITLLDPTGLQTINVWSTPLVPGSYDIIMDENNNGVYDSGELVDQGAVNNGLFVVPEVAFGTTIICLFASAGTFYALKRYRAK